MRSYSELLDLAIARKGSAAAVFADMAVPLSPEALAATSDDRWLAAMARMIFQAGISWKVVEAKWPGIEAAFNGFDPGPLAFMDDDGFDALLADSRVIRSGAKIEAIRQNAGFIRRISAESGRFGAKMAAWPEADFGGLLIWLQSEGSRLGGNTGAYTLRQMGRDGFMLSHSVVARLEAEGVISGTPASKRNLMAAQEAFAIWRGQGGPNLTTISRVLAYSIDG